MIISRAELYHSKQVADKERLSIIQTPRHSSGIRQHAWLADGAAHTHGLASRQSFTSRQHEVTQAADLQEALGCAEDHSQGVLRELWGDLGVLL